MRVWIELQVVLTFSMQGVGNFVNTGVLIILLVIFQCAVPNHSNPQRPYAHHLCALPQFTLTCPLLNLAITLSQAAPVLPLCRCQWERPEHLPGCLL